METAHRSVPEEWLGRDREFVFFLNWLERAGPEDRWILSLQDAAPGHWGGCGKSWLLRAWVARARQRFPQLPIVQVDGICAAEQDPLVIAQRLVEQLQALFAPWQAYAFRETLAVLVAQGRLREACGGRALADRGLGERLWTALAHDLRALLPLLPERGPTVLFVYDSLELLAPGPEGMVLAPGRRFPESFGLPRVKVLLASRRPLDGRQPLWRGREREVWGLALAPWSPAEVEQVLKQAGVSPRPGEPSLGAVSEWLAALTGGRPALVRLACWQLARGQLRLAGLSQLEQAAFEERLVAWLAALEEPLAWWLLVLAQLVPGPSEPGVAVSWLAKLLGQLPLDRRLGLVPGVGALRERLQAVPMVRMSRDGESVTLAEEIRRLVVRYGWERQDPDGRFRRELSRAVVRLCEGEQGAEEELPEAAWQARQVLLVAHWLKLDREEGWRRSQDRLSWALAHGRRGLAWRLLGVLRQEELSPAQREQLDRWERELLGLEELERAQGGRPVLA